MKKPVEEWKAYIYPTLVSKQNEFSLYGYDDIPIEKIWECLFESVWKGNKTLRLHEIVSDIFHLSINTYMDHITIGAITISDNELLKSLEEITEHEKDQNIN